jgi:hypothetical protein
MDTRLPSRPDNLARTARPIVTIVCAGRSAVLDLRRIKATRFESVIVVRLEALWIEGRLGADLSGLRFDFVGEDGFRPSRAGHPLLPGEHLKNGYLNTRSRNLIWDDPSIDPAFCVHGVTMIVAHGGP